MSSSEVVEQQENDHVTNENKSEKQEPVTQESETATIPQQAPAVQTVSEADAAASLEALACFALEKLEDVVKPSDSLSQPQSNPATSLVIAQVASALSSGIEDAVGANSNNNSTINKPTTPTAARKSSLTKSSIEQKKKKKRRDALHPSESDADESDSGDEEETDGSIIRCPCDNNIDRGLMIQCETCLVWQHSLCVGIREDKLVPAHYFCERCLPRNFKCVCSQNAAIGKIIECSECGTWQHIRCLGKGPRALPKPYRCPNCDPTYFTALNKNKSTATTTNPPGVPRTTEKKGPGRKKKIRELGIFQTLRLDNELREELKDDFLSFSKQIQKQAKQWDQPSTDTLLAFPIAKNLLDKYCLKYCDSKTKEMDLRELLYGLSVLLRCTVDVMREAFKGVANSLMQSPKTEGTNPAEGWTTIKENIYSPSLEKPHATNTTGTFSETSHSIGKVSESTWGFLANEAVRAEQFIIEYLGRISNRKEVNCSNLPSEERRFVLVPPVLSATGVPSQTEESDVCIDARKWGNNARFIRRSCKPNARVKQISADNWSRVGIFAVDVLPSTTEVTIPFDFQWRQSKYMVKCACGSEECEATQWFKHRSAGVEKLLEVLNAPQVPENGLSSLSSTVSATEAPATGPLSTPPHSSPTTPGTSAILVDESSNGATSLGDSGKKKHRLGGSLGSIHTSVEGTEPAKKKRNTSSLSSSATSISASSSYENLSPTLMNGGNGEKLGREERKIAMLMQRFERMEQLQSKKRKSKEEKEGKEPKEKKEKKEKKDKELHKITRLSNKGTPGKKGRASTASPPPLEDGQSNGATEQPENVVVDNPSKTNGHPTIKEEKQLTVKIEERVVPAAPTPEKPSDASNNPSSPTNQSDPTTPTYSKAKYGKKAWILEYQEEQKESTQGPNTSSPILNGDSNGPIIPSESNDGSNNSISNETNIKTMDDNSIFATNNTAQQTT